MTKDKVLNFLRSHDLAVVATVDKQGNPQAAVVEYGELEDLTIIIDTLTTSRKYKNLQSNKRVAIVIGWDENITIQIDAIAKELKGDDLKLAKEAYFLKNERARKWEEYDTVAYFAFKPIWLRYSDVDQSPWQIEELEL